MQSLNAREYYVLMIITIMVIVIATLLGRELISETSPFVSNPDGELVNVRQVYIMNIIQTSFQLILCITAFIFLLKIHRAGWIIAFSLIVFYTVLLSTVMVIGANTGFYDPIYIVGIFAVAMVLLAIIFLCLPSTIRKFKITKAAIIPILCLWALMVTIYFILPQ
jgi:hypothetical protein